MHGLEYERGQRLLLDKTIGNKKKEVFSNNTKAAWRKICSLVNGLAKKAIQRRAENFYSNVI